MKIFEAAFLLRTGKISREELIEEVYGKIDKEAFITVCRLEDVNNSSYLSGIPVAIKDNICTKGVLTTAGSRMLENFVPEYNASVVDRLLQAGAVIVGKTNMDEFGMGSEGKFSAFGKMRNPVNGEYISGGSSAGSAIAVKKGMALGALGSDTGGSVRQPASLCGVYGLRPTYSLVSRFGLIAFASSLDTIGPICTCSKDIAIMLDCIAGGDKKDATAKELNTEKYYLNIKPCVNGMRFGVIKEVYDACDSDIKAAFDKGVKILEALGAKIEFCSFESSKYAVSSYYIISSCEASSNLGRYCAVGYGKRENGESFEEMVRNSRSAFFGDEVKRRILAGTYVLSEGCFNQYYLKAKEAQKIIKSEFKELFKIYDLILTPTLPKKAWRVSEKTAKSDVYKSDLCTVLASVAGMPAMSVPCGADENNMPVGMQIIGDEFSEQKILNASLAFEEGYSGA